MMNHLLAFDPVVMPTMHTGTRQQLWHLLGPHPIQRKGDAVIYILKDITESITQGKVIAEGGVIIWILARLKSPYLFKLRREWWWPTWIQEITWSRSASECSFCQYSTVSSFLLEGKHEISLSSAKDEECKTLDLEDAHDTDWEPLYHSGEPTDSPDHPDSSQLLPKTTEGRLARQFYMVIHTLGEWSCQEKLLCKGEWELSLLARVRAKEDRWESKREESNGVLRQVKKGLGVNHPWPQWAEWAGE